MQQEALENESKPTTSKIVDPFLRNSSRKRERMMVSALQFLPAGSIIEKGEILRSELALSKRPPEGDAAQQAELAVKQVSRKLYRTGVKKVGLRVKHHVSHHLTSDADSMCRMVGCGFAC